MRQLRNRLLDEIKGLAILAVVLFHLGLFKWGYLGVDVFFVIAGFLTEKSIARRINERTFSYFGFIKDRLIRLWPIVIIAGLVSLILGCCLMMPDDLDHMARSVFASDLFLNNILCYHSNSDYWATKNDYAPMLHFWYLGVLMQFYLVCPLVSRFGNKTIGALGIASFIAWLVTPVPLHFYNFPFRFFEFALGMLAAHRGLNVPEFSLRIPGLAAIGAASFSVYIWHYIILAYARYALALEVSALSGLAYAAILAVASYASYVFLEKQSMKLRYAFVLFVLNAGLALTLFYRAGVVFDIPELDIVANNAKRGMHLQYCDRIFQYRGAFPSNGKKNILVYGNSWARDWANVLLESSIADDINIVYSFDGRDLSNAELVALADKADVVFILGTYLPRVFVNNERFYFIGYKWFGPSNGYVWNRRFSHDYYETRISVPTFVLDIIEREKLATGDRYIDIMGALMDEAGNIPVFSPDRKMISHDCYHLTRGGARFIAKKMDNRIMEMVK